MIFVTVLTWLHDGCGCSCRFESKCLLVGPGTLNGMLTVGVFLRDPRENHGKLQTARSTSATGFEPGTSRLPVLSVTAMPLAGLGKRWKKFNMKTEIS